MHSKIRIAIADDHVLVRKAISNIINTNNLFDVILEADDGMQLISMIEDSPTEPHICILDISMKEMNGFDTLEILKRKWPAIKVLMLTIFSSRFNITKAFKMGANGFLLKDSDPEELYLSLREIYTKGVYLSKIITDGVMENIRNESIALPKITDREMEFLTLCCRELTYAEIAEAMGIGQRTVDTYRESLFEKFEVSSRTGLVMHALQNGIIPLG